MDAHHAAMAGAFRLFAQCWPGRFEAVPGSLQTWTSLLADCTPNEIKRGAVRLAREAQHPPSPSTLRRAAKFGPRWDGSLADDHEQLPAPEPDFEAAARALAPLWGTEQKRLT